MYCFKCGASLEEGAKYCNSCGNEVEESFDITYEDVKEDVADPIILESHTFIEGEELPNKIEEELKKEKSKKRTSILQMFLFLVLFLSIMGGVGYFVLIPIFLPKDEPIIKKMVISDDLSSGEVSINGEIYSLKKPYSYYERNGWHIDSSYIARDYETILEKKERTPMNYEFSNLSIHGAKIQVGFYNSLDESNVISDCSIYGISAMFDGDDSNLEFILPGQIKDHSTIEDVTSKYGEVSEDDIFSFEEEGYVIYHYEKENSYLLDLTFYDNGGLLGFRYEIA